MTKRDDMLKELSKPFEEKDIQWRIQQSGIGANGKPWAMALAYVDARAIMDRLDDVCGLHWNDSYRLVQESTGKIIGVECSLTIDDVTRVDGSEQTDIEAFKGGYSKALVRTAVKFGIGRYLYKLPTTFVQCQMEKPSSKDGWNSAKDSKTHKFFYWKTPSMPKEFLPSK